MWTGLYWFLAWLALDPGDGGSIFLQISEVPLDYMILYPKR
jgi:hypothetical protein